LICSRRLTEANIDSVGLTLKIDEKSFGATQSRNGDPVRSELDVHFACLATRAVEREHGIQDETGQSRSVVDLQVVRFGVGEGAARLHRHADHVDEQLLLWMQGQTLRAVLIVAVVVRVAGRVHETLVQSGQSALAVPVANTNRRKLTRQFLKRK
jgi:hypothetical protein